MIIEGLLGDLDPFLLLLEFKSYLKSKGEYYLKDIIKVKDNIKITCPFHSQGQENTPSCFVSTVNIEKNGKFYKEGTVHCFACGHTSYITEMMSELLGRKDGGILGKKWIISNFKGISYDDSITIMKSINIKNSLNKLDSLLYNSDIKREANKLIKEEELDSYRYVVDYMYNRGLTDEAITFLDIGYQKGYLNEGKKYNVITIPVRNEFGEVVNIIRRVASHKVKKFFLPIGEKPILGLWECLNTPYTNDIIITEGVFDYLYLWSLGYRSICLIGLGSYNQYKKIESLGVSSFILAFDNDEPGTKATKRFHSHFKYLNLSVINIPEGFKDINNLNKDLFEDLYLNRLDFYAWSLIKNL